MQRDPAVDVERLTGNAITRIDGAAGAVAVALPVVVARCWLPVVLKPQLLVPMFTVMPVASVRLFLR